MVLYFVKHLVTLVLKGAIEIKFIIIIIIIIMSREGMEFIFTHVLLCWYRHN